MKRILSLLAAGCLVAACTGGKGGGQCAESVIQPDYSTYFTDESLRIDLVLAGNATTQTVYLDKLWRECLWAGPRGGLIDPFGYGDYRCQAFDGDRLIFSRGFNSLFEEWRTTEEAGQVSKAMGQTLWMPFPKQAVRIVISGRDRGTGQFGELLSFVADPQDRHITAIDQSRYRTVPMQITGDCADKVDIVIVAEAYTGEQMDKFRDDCRKMMDYVFSMEPYASHREDFNVTMVESVSEDGGVDIPQNGLWRNTVMDSSFDTFYEDRYLTVTDHRKIADAVAGVPSDAIIVLANESKYGGGGIYNSYALGTSDNKRSQEVFIHEFGHSFAGLGDEYYDSSVAYDGFYNMHVEPWEPNVTTLVDFGSKWEDMLEEGSEIPTPADDSHASIVGVYEGAGYMSKGCYRPYIDCRMKSNAAPGFCPVCQRAITAAIDYYCGRGE